MSIGVKEGGRINIGGERVGGKLIDHNDRPKLIGYTMKGGEVLEVLSIESKDLIHVRYKGVEYAVTDKERTRLEDNVFVSCGLSNGKGPDDYSRLAFEAPRSVRIERLPG